MDKISRGSHSMSKPGRELYPTMDGHGKKKRKPLLSRTPGITIEIITATNLEI